MKIASITLILVLIASVFAWQQSGRTFANLWRSPDRQGQILMNHQQYLEAAEVSTDPMQRGAALFQAGEFKRALTVFNTIPTPEGVYNRANCQMMLGKYDAAITLYDRALKERQGWTAAIDNRAIAVARKAALAPPDSDDGGTGGQLEADEIVFDDQGKKGSSVEMVDGENEESMSDEEMRALWLRKVQTKPADFLRAKFSYQVHQAKAQTETQTEASSNSTSKP